MIIILLLIFYYISCSFLTKNLNNDLIDRNSNHIYYLCYKKRTKTFCMFLRSCLGIHVCSSALIINNKLYRLKKNKEYMQAEDFTLDYIYNKYYVLNTGYTTNDLSNDWEVKLLKQKRIRENEFFKSCNCLKSCGVVLNQLKGFEIGKQKFTSIYMLKLIATKKWKIKKLI